MFVLNIRLAKIIQELDHVILKGVDLCYHTKEFLWRTLKHYKVPMLCTF